jgi:hypothetical protein
MALPPEEKKLTNSSDVRFWHQNLNTRVGMANPISPELHDLALAEVLRLRRDYQQRRDAVTAELRSIYVARQTAGSPVPALVGDRTKEARQRAREILNGHTPTWLQVDNEDREPGLLVEREALDLVLHALANDEVVALSSAAAAWVVANKAAWIALVREIIVAATRLRALERRADAMIADIPMAVGGLPLAEFIGRGDGVLAAGGEDPLAEVREAALQDGIVTKSEIRKAENVVEN